MEKSVEQFFDGMGDLYGSAIERCVPRYAEMLDAILDYLPGDFEPRTALELGCGTGNLSEKILRRFPGVRLRLVDVSGVALESARARVGVTGRVEIERNDFSGLAYAGGAFDLVASSISLHHLPDGEKPALYERVHDWLGPAGVFAFSDQFAGATKDIHARHMEGWRKASAALGATGEEWREWMAHQEAHDHHATLRDHLSWLGTAGFGKVDCPWRYLLWTVLIAEKDGEGG